jgi:predicted lipid-binding transport protein (Tim44 family)
MISTALEPGTRLIGSCGPRPPGDASFERGLQDIRRNDRGFDPTRFTGYAGLLFRAAQDAWMARDMAPLRDRVTAEMHEALQAGCDLLRSSRRVNRIDEVEIIATVTDVWQASGRDYVTARVSGSLIDYVVDEARDVVVDGSPTTPRRVDEFWTFTRPAGLNFWMLSGIEA